MTSDHVSLASVREPADPSATLDAQTLTALLPEGRTVLAVEGMWCASCASAVERVIARTPGMLDARVSFDGMRAVLRWDPERADLNAVAGRVAALGYRLARPASADDAAERIEQEMHAVGARLALAVFLAAWTMALSLLLYLDTGGIVGTPTGRVLATLATLLAAVTVLVAGGPMLHSGWRTLRAGVPGMDALIGLGASSALALSIGQLALGSDQIYADTAAMLVTLALIGRLVELAATRRASLAIAALQQGIQEIAEERDAEGRWRAVRAECVKAGTLIRLAAGARAPLDALVERGSSSLDRSLLTGEVVPVAVDPGDRVEAGCINLRSPLFLRVTGEVGQRRIDRLGLRIGEALGEKGATQRLAEGFARVLVPVALGLALLALLGGLAFGLSGTDALLRAVSVLVVACPCAVALAVPLTWVAAASRGARAGILFRTPRAIEGLAKVRAVLFDKTGTLTAGRPEVVDTTAAPGATAPQVLAWAALAEQGIVHPLAAALRRAAPSHLESLTEQDEADQNASGGDTWTRERHGRLVRLYRPGSEVLVGAADALAECGVDIPARPTSCTGTIVEVARDGAWLGRIQLHDPLRADSAAALAALRSSGMAVAMITGDQAASALPLAARLGMRPNQVHADATPEDKARLVAAMPCPSAFVGDGINDGVALARAAAGIAVSEATDTATAAADILLTRQGIAGVVQAHNLAVRARRIMLQNLSFAGVYNGAGLLLAISGAIPPVVAALAMTASSLCVTANAARLGWSRLDEVQGDLPREVT